MSDAVYDLLIIYNDKTKHIVKHVSNYSIIDDCFTYEKNGYRSFVPKDKVIFFGRRFDYDND